MPRGHNIARCVHCGKEWVVGDCIPITCDECLGQGHTESFSCPKCWPARQKERRMKPSKTYLGDAVYAEADDFGGVILTTEDGLRATNTIELEPQVIRALQEYLAAMKRAQEAARAALEEEEDK